MVVPQDEAKKLENMEQDPPHETENMNAAEEAQENTEPTTQHETEIETQDTQENKTPDDDLVKKIFLSAVNDLAPGDAVDPESASKMFDSFKQKLATMNIVIDSTDIVDEEDTTSNNEGGPSSSSRGERGAAVLESLHEEWHSDSSSTLHASDGDMWENPPDTLEERLKQTPNLEDSLAVATAFEIDQEKKDRKEIKAKMAKAHQEAVLKAGEVLWSPLTNKGFINSLHTCI